MYSLYFKIKSYFTNRAERYALDRKSVIEYKMHILQKMLVTEPKATLRNHIKGKINKLMNEYNELCT